MKKDTPALKKSDDKIVDGVIGGIADYFGVERTIFRIIAVLILISEPIGFILFYIFASIIMSDTDDIKENKKQPVPRGDKSKFLGEILIGLGVMFMIQNIFEWFSWDYVWPLFIISFGIYMLKGR